MKEPSALLVMLWWVCGIAVAQGFASTALAIIFPPWAWYVFVEFALHHFGWI